MYGMLYLVSFYLRTRKRPVASLCFFVLWSPGQDYKLPIIIFFYLA